MTEPTPDADPVGTDEPKGSNREAKYRRRLRDTEAERDQLRDQLETMRRGEAERLSELAQPQALWATGTTVDDLLDEQGTVDGAKVTEAAQRATDQLGAAPKPRSPKPDLSQGAKSGTASPRDRWEAAFGPDQG